MIVNSKFSSLYLGCKNEWKVPFDQDVCFIQKYAADEELRIQFTGNEQNYYAKYISCSGVETNLAVQLLYTDPVTGYGTFEIFFSISEIGIYCFEISNGTEKVVSYFKIADDVELENTILLRYTHRKNEYESIFINSDNSKKYFSFRIDGGIFPSGKSQAIDNNFFRDQRFTLHQISAQAYEISVLTIGSTKGVPQWVGNRINHIFSLSDISIDGIETKRNEGSTVEIVELSKYYPLFVFKLNVEQSDEEKITLGEEDDGGGTVIPPDPESGDFNNDFNNDFNS